MKKNKNIIVWGSAGHGSAVLDLINNVGLKIILFLDESSSAKAINKSKLIKGKNKVSNFISQKKLIKKYLYTVAIGSNQKVRFKIYNFLKKRV